MNIVSYWHAALLKKQLEAILMWKTNYIVYYCHWWSMCWLVYRYLKPQAFTCNVGKKRSYVCA